MATSSCRARAAPTVSPACRGGSARTSRGTPLFQRISHRTDAMPGVCSAGLRIVGLPQTSDSRRHAAGDGEREVPRADDGAHAARLDTLLVVLADELAQPPRLEEVDSLACVKLAEVDRLADVGVGLPPRLAALLDDDPGQLVPPLPHQVGRPCQAPRPVDRRRVPPRRQCRLRLCNHVPQRGTTVRECHRDRGSRTRIRLGRTNVGRLI